MESCTKDLIGLLKKELKPMSLDDYIFAFSHALPNKEGKKGSVELGKAHYSYKSVRDKFCELMDSTGTTWIDVVHPESMREETLKRSFLSSSSERKFVHISFKPPHLLRAAGGFYNIAYIAWEFDKLPGKYANWPILPSNDIKRMLKAFDQTWVGSRYAQKVLTDNGIDNVEFIPAPIKETPVAPHGRIDKVILLKKFTELGILCWPVVARNHRYSYAQPSQVKKVDLTELLSRSRTNGGKVFLQIVNPHDRRKNLHKLIRAFQAYNYENSESVLLIKFTSPEKNEDAYTVFNWLLEDSHIIDANGVYFTTDYIPESIKSQFFALFDFYLSPSRAEGQNLPLQEAMSVGLIPITTDNTAMSDYINSRNSFILSSDPVEVTNLTNPDRNFWGMTWYDLKSEDIYKKIIEATRAKAQTLAIMSNEAKITMKEKYSFEVIHNSIISAVKKLGAK